MGVITSVKHFIGNEQETDRNLVSANIDDKTMHEVYLWPFQDAIHAGTANIMCRLVQSLRAGNTMADGAS